MEYVALHSRAKIQLKSFHPGVIIHICIWFLVTIINPIDPNGNSTRSGLPRLSLPRPYRHPSTPTRYLTYIAFIQLETHNPEISQLSSITFLRAQRSTNKLTEPPISGQKEFGEKQYVTPHTSGYPSPTG